MNFKTFDDHTLDKLYEEIKIDLSITKNKYDKLNIIGDANNIDITTALSEYNVYLKLTRDIMKELLKRLTKD